MLKLSCSGDCYIFFFPCFLSLTSSGKEFRCQDTPPQAFGTMVVRPIGWKTSESKACRTHHASLIPPSPRSFGSSHQQLCSPSQTFRISPLHLEESLFSPHQQTGNCTPRDQSVTRRQAPLTSYLVSRLLGLSGRGWDGGGRSHSAGLQTNPGRAGIGGVAGWERAMEQPSCKGQQKLYLPTWRFCFSPSP